MTPHLFVILQRPGGRALNLAIDHIEAIETTDGLTTVRMISGQDYRVQQSNTQVLELIRSVEAAAREAEDMRAVRAEDPRGRTHACPS